MKQHIGVKRKDKLYSLCFICPQTKQLWSKLSRLIADHIYPHLTLFWKIVVFGFTEYDRNLYSQFYSITHFDQSLYSQIKILTQKAKPFRADCPYQTILLPQQKSC